ncbi:MAG: DUF952 domain-containing protein [Xanthobacteraceae bacterium]|nr:DUF952 domain-containing protein [Hyphomicrobiales bacterium]MBN9001832.1 DUF952 domain-containing protein [Hyphomicrobiales bacterium]
MRIIYKICPASAWREAERHGVYDGSADDKRDGFIHFSTAAQLAETARKHFAGQIGLFLIAVDADALGDALRWEPSRNGDLFPHLYEALDLGAVTTVYDLPVRADGGHDIPELSS